MGFTAGLNDKFYRNSGSYGTPTFSELDALSDIEAPHEANPIEVKIRRNAYISNLVGLKKFGPVSFPLATEPDNTQWQAMQTAFNAKTVGEYFQFYKGDSATTGSKAIRFPAYVTKFSSPQKLEDFDVNEVELSLSANVFSTATTTDPVIYTVA